MRFFERHTQSLCGHSSGFRGIFSLPSLSFSTSSRFFIYGGTFFLHTKVMVRSVRSALYASHT